MSLLGKRVRATLKFQIVQFTLVLCLDYFAFRAFERELVSFSIDFLFSIRGSGSGEGDVGGIVQTPIPLVPGINKTNTLLF